MWWKNNSDDVERLHYLICTLIFFLPIPWLFQLFLLLYILLLQCWIEVNWSRTKNTTSNILEKHACCCCFLPLFSTLCEEEIILTAGRRRGVAFNNACFKQSQQNVHSNVACTDIWRYYSLFIVLTWLSAHIVLNLRRLSILLYGLPNKGIEKTRGTHHIQS